RGARAGPGGGGGAQPVPRRMNFRPLLSSATLATLGDASLRHELLHATLTSAYPSPSRSPAIPKSRSTWWVKWNSHGPPLGSVMVRSTFGWAVPTPATWTTRIVADRSSV